MDTTICGQPTDGMGPIPPVRGLGIPKRDTVVALAVNRSGFLQGSWLLPVNLEVIIPGSLVVTGSVLRCPQIRFHALHSRRANLVLSTVNQRLLRN